MQKKKNKTWIKIQEKKYGIKMFTNATVLLLSNSKIQVQEVD